MKHLALILSPHVRKLELLDKAVHGVGLRANCCDSVSSAIELMRRYADDYHVMLVDEECFGDDKQARVGEDSGGKCAESFLNDMLAASPNCRFMYLVGDESDFQFQHGRVAIRRMSDIHSHLPRIRNEVTRERTRRIKLGKVAAESTTASAALASSDASRSSNEARSEA